MGHCRLHAAGRPHMRVGQPNLPRRMLLLIGVRVLLGLSEKALAGDSGRILLNEPAAFDIRMWCRNCDHCFWGRTWLRVSAIPPVIERSSSIRGFTIIPAPAPGPRGRPHHFGTYKTCI